MIRKVRAQTDSAGRPIPVSLIEWNPIAPDQADIARRGIWAMAAGGGTYQIFNKDERPAAVQPEVYDFRLWAEHWRYARILKELMQSLPLDRMAPDNSLVTNGFCLAAGEERVFLVYLPEGGQTTLALPEEAREYHVYWIDPAQRGEDRKPCIAVRGERFYGSRRGRLGAGCNSGGVGVDQAGCGKIQTVC